MAEAESGEAASEIVSRLSGGSVGDPDYDEVLIEEVQFTHGELDMIYFSCLAYMGHPQAKEWTLTDDGFASLVRGLKKIQDWNEQQETAGEPEVVSPR